MKVLFLASERYPPYRVDVADLIARRLPARGFQIDWLLQPRHPARHPRREAYGGGTAFVGRSVAGDGFRARLANVVLDAINDLRLPGLVRRLRPDVIVVRDKVMAAVPALLVARVMRVRFAYWQSYPVADAALFAARDGSIRWPWLALLRGWFARIVLYRLVMPRADRVFVQSRQMARDFERSGVPAARMTPVPMGVALERMPHPFTVRHTSKPPDEKWIVYLGTLARVRGLEVLVRAMARVVAVCPAARLYLVGAGDNEEDERAIRHHVASAGLADAVVFTGFLDMERAWEYAALADVCVSPFRRIPIMQSTSPTKLIEYMALARPVVASRHPEQDEILRESGAGVSVAYEEEPIADAILRVLADPATAEAMGRRGRSWVERHRHYDAIADLVSATLTGLASSAPGDPDQAR